MKTMFFKKWSYVLLLTAIVAQTSCITENSTPSSVQDFDENLEKVWDESVAFPLENLRMDPTTLKMLADLRAATAKYHRLEVAMANGYGPGSNCVASSAGGMGFHYVNFDLVDGIFDPTQPEALLYEMDKNGQMKLVGAEFILVKALWDLENEMKPYFGHHEFEEAFAPIPLPFDNYQLHVWIWKNNPSGIFTPFNPKVQCN
jgi:hypothetical protein